MTPNVFSGARRWVMMGMSLAPESLDNSDLILTSMYKLLPNEGTLLYTRLPTTAMLFPLPVQETPVEWPVLDQEVRKLPGGRRSCEKEKPTRDGDWTV